MKILIMLEDNNGKIHRMGLESIVAAQKMASELNGELGAVVMGKNADALADEGGPGPAAIGKYVAPRALLWFRMAAAATWLTGAWALSISPQYGFTQTFLFQAPAGPMMSLGAWMGTIMLFNVWVLIWPNQKKVLGIVEASADDIAKAKFTAAMASRTNVVLSVPMLLCMVGAGHGGYLF